MVATLPSPAELFYGLFTGRTLFLAIHLLGMACFLFIVGKRLLPLRRAETDLRFDRWSIRIGNVAKFWLAQWRQPRYPLAGVLHILIFAGFLVLAIRSLTLIGLGTFHDFALPGFSGLGGDVYDVVKDYTSTVVVVCVVAAAIRRAVFKPARYAVPPKYGKDHTSEALLVLGLIGLLMICESLFSASAVVLAAEHGRVQQSLPPLSLAWCFGLMLSSLPSASVLNLYRSSYFIHEVTLFSFLCFLPMGKHFHVVTSLFNVYFAKLDRGTVKPVRWGVPDDKLDQIKSFGVKTFEDFTWKHILDFYSCADCGRCSDNCPSNAAGRPLSPRFLTIKAREYAFKHYPILSRAHNHQPLIGNVYSEDEIWSCTTCGACEQECPLLIEYVDKIVDLRRGMVDDGKVPQSIQKALKGLESRGNPYGKMPKKRADWIKAGDFAQSCTVQTLANGKSAETLYFVDSITSYDDRIQSIGHATARILSAIGEDFGILGAAEKDSGHEVRRFGEEMLFHALLDDNREAIKASGVKRIVTADPHAFNALRHDYTDIPPVEHISQVVAREVRSGKLKLTQVASPEKVYTYHDPCYLGRHNQVYDDPREVLDAIPGLNRVEMKRCRDRAFCCGGGGLMLFYEPKEEQRMGVLRVKMAAEVGANVIVTACPFCMVNIEDAIKVAGLEGKMTAIDLAELVDQHIGRDIRPVDAALQLART
jgi:Fe-S oxidoreductase